MTTEPWEADSTWVRMGGWRYRHRSNPQITPALLAATAMTVCYIASYAEPPARNLMARPRRSCWPRWNRFIKVRPIVLTKELDKTCQDCIAKALAAIAKARGVEPYHDPPDSRNHMAKPYDDALIGHLRNNPPRNE